MQVNTSTEYWQKGASLLHTDPLGKNDAVLPEGERIYLIAGTQHAGRAHMPGNEGNCRLARNPHSAAPALRALLVALDAWVVDGVRPPRNRIPLLRDGTFVPFAVTKAEREAAKDPRLSLEERYKDRKGWLGYLRAVVYDLARERLLLKEDADRIVDAAELVDPFKR